jgi:hypothetical protein
MSTAFHFRAALPTWIIILSALLLLAGVAWSARILTGKRLPRRWIFTLTILRISAVVIFIVGLMQPVISYSRTTQPKPALTVVIDTSASMGIDDGGGSRLKHATMALSEGAFADHLRKHFTIEWYEARPYSAPIDPKNLARLQAAGETTKLAEALAGAVEQTRGRLGRGRVLLVSDGADHGLADASSAAARLGLPVDVLPVGAASSVEQPLSVAEVQASARVLLGSETRFLVIARGAPKSTERTVTLHLAEDGREVQSGPMTILGGSSEGRAEISHRPETPGLKRYTIYLSGGDVGDSEYPVNVQVLDRAHEVLILEDTWRWEFKYLKRTVEDDPSFRFTAILARGPATQMQFGSPDRKAPLIGMPRNGADLAAFELIMLGDVNPAKWPRGVDAEIARAVKEDGKSLVVIAGPNLGKISENPELHSLLPVELAPESGAPTEGEIEVRADEYAAHFFFDASARDAKLPPLERVYAPVRKRPAARVWLESTKLANSYGPLIVMAEQTVGRGRVLFIGTDSLYQWQTNTANESGISPHRVFWQRALRALTPARPLNDAGVWLLPERTRLEAGQALTVWAEARGEAVGGSLKMDVALSDGKPTVLSTVRDSAHPGRWRATFTPAKTGAYRVTASVQVDGQPAGDSATVVEATPNGELTDTSPNPENLERIARASGGQVVDPSQSATWPHDDASEVVERRTVDFWGDGLILILLTSVLGLDWLLRLLRGYV